MKIFIIQIKWIMTIVLMVFSSITQANANTQNLVQEPFNVGAINADVIRLDGGSIKLTANKDSAYGFIRMSLTGWEGTLTKDLTANDKIKIAMTLTPSSNDFYMIGQGLDLPLITPHVSKKEVTIVKEVSLLEYSYGEESVYIALHLKNAGDTLIVKDLHVEKIEDDEKTTSAAISVNLVSKQYFLTDDKTKLLHNADGSVGIVSPDNYSYLYTTLSSHNILGALKRDLVAGEKITLKIRAKSSSKNSVIFSSTLDFPNKRFSKPNIYENFLFDATVKENISSVSSLIFLAREIGTKIDVKSIEIFEKSRENTITDTPLPSCDTSNPKVQIIENINDWDTINNLNKKIFCISPLDYSSLGSIKITTSGTKTEPRYIILNNGNNKHPVQLDKAQLAKYRLEFDNANYWIVDRQAYWEDISPHNRLLKLSSSSFNIFNRGFLEDTANGITLYNGSNYNTIQNFHMEKTQWSVDYAYNHKPNKELPPYNEQIFADLAAIGLVGTNPDDKLIGNKIINNEIINYVDGIQLTRIYGADKPKNEPNPPLDASGTIISNNIIYTTPILYTDKFGNFQKNGKYAVSENALDFKFGSLDKENPIIVKNNVMFGYRSVDNTYSNLADNGNAFVLHYGAGNIVFEENYIFDCKNGFAVGAPKGSDPAIYNVTFKNNIFYDMKEGIDHIYGTRAINSFDGTKNVLLENNIFGKVGGYSSLHAYNTNKLTIKNNKFVNTKAMYFAPDFNDLKSNDLQIIGNIFYETAFTGIPYFSIASDNTHSDNFDWTPYKTKFKIKIHTDTPMIKNMGVE